MTDSFILFAVRRSYLPDKFRYFIGDVTDPNVKAVIRKNFISLMKNSGWMPPQFCANDPQCTEDNVTVYAGESKGTANA